jgi:hypothetical protein
MTTRGSLVLAFVALLGAAGVLVQALGDPSRALVAFTAAYGFGVGTALGALVLAMSLFASGAKWPLVLMPRILAIASTLPVFALLFVPIALGLHHVYPWAHETSGLEPTIAAALEHQRMWNSPSFFLARSVAYLASWCFLGLFVARAYDAHVRAPSAQTLSRLRRISGGGLPIIAFTLTFASFDWLMSVEPGWVSNAYGLYFGCGGLASAVSLVAVLAWSQRRHELPAPNEAHVHAVGRLMLMAVILWAYIGFFQLMLMWIGDLPREVTFFVKRARGSFVVLDVILVFGHFVLPFLALLSRPLKRSPALLALVGAWLVLMNAVDLEWLVLPSSTRHVELLDAAPFLLVSAIALAHGALRLRTTELPTRDPAFAESLRYSSP